MSENDSEIARLKSRVKHLEAELALYRAIELGSDGNSFTEALVNSRPVLKSFLNHTTYGVAVKDCDLQIRFLNSSLQRMLGRSEENILISSDKELFAGQTADILENDDRWVMANRRHLERERDVELNGRKLRLRIHKSPIIDSNGKLAGVFIVMVDLTKREPLGEDQPEQSPGRMIPVCSSCKKIRDDQGRWIPLETYLMTRWGVEPTHTICPECAKVLYPELNLKGL